MSRGNKKTVTHLLDAVKVRCIGNAVHTIGIASNGQLFFSDHSTTDMKRLLAVEEMGGKACRCARFYQYWRSGNRAALKDFSATLAAERAYQPCGIGRRLQRKLRNKRSKFDNCNWPETISFSACQRSLTILKKNTCGLAHSFAVISWVCRKIINLLVKRGWPRRELSYRWCNVSRVSAYVGNVHLLSIRRVNDGFLRVRTCNGDSITMSHKSARDIPLRLLADITEIGLLDAIRSERKCALESASRYDLSWRVKKVVSESKISKVLETEIGVIDNELMTINLRMATSVTPAGLRLLMKQLDDVAAKIYNVLVTDTSRQSSQNRFPPPSAACEQ